MWPKHGQYWKAEKVRLQDWVKSEYLEEDQLQIQTSALYKPLHCIVADILRSGPGKELLVIQAISSRAVI